jgi:hypothetical protein
VDSNGGTCTRSASPADYADAAACSTFEAAYTAASAGDTVRIDGGSYAAQTIDATQKASGSNVVFRPATGETVTLTGQLDVNASRITIMDVDVGNNDAYMGVPGGDPPSFQTITNVVFDNVDARSLRIYSASDSTVRNSEFGPVSSCGGPYGGENSKVDDAGATHPTPSNITLEGNSFHDHQTYDSVSCHTECLALFGVQSATVRRNIFYNCAFYDIFIKDNAGLGMPGPFVFENNIFGSTHNYHVADQNGTTLAFCTHPTGTKIVNNSFQSQGSFEDCGVTTWTNAVIQGNTGQAQFDVCSFASGITYSYNAWTNRSACGGTGDQGNVSNPFVNNVAGSEGTLGFDLHITAGATSLLGAIPAGSSQLSEALDIDGNARSTNYDIGADER